MTCGDPPPLCKWYSVFSSIGVDTTCDGDDGAQATPPTPPPPLDRLLSSLPRLTDSCGAEYAGPSSVGEEEGTNGASPRMLTTLCFTFFSCGGVVGRERLRAHVCVWASYQRVIHIGELHLRRDTILLVFNQQRLPQRIRSIASAKGLWHGWHCKTVRVGGDRTKGGVWEGCIQPPHPACCSGKASAAR